jgi:hypothetical protein
VRKGKVHIRERMERAGTVNRVDSVKVYSKDSEGKRIKESELKKSKKVKRGEESEAMRLK